MTEHHNSNKLFSDIPKVDFKNVNFKTLQNGLKDILEILRINKKKIDEVANRESEGVGLALVYFIIGTLGAPLGGAIIGYSFLGVSYRTSIWTALIEMVIAVLVGILGIYILNLVAKMLFHGKGEFSKFLRVMGYASLLNFVGFLTVAPFLKNVVMIWMLVVQFFALREIHKLDNTKTVLTIIAATVLSVLIVALLDATLGAALLPGVGGFGSITTSLK